MQTVRRKQLLAAASLTLVLGLSFTLVRAAWAASASISTWAGTHSTDVPPFSVFSANGQVTGLPVDGMNRNTDGIVDIKAECNGTNWVTHDGTNGTLDTTWSAQPNATGGNQTFAVSVKDIFHSHHKIGGFPPGTGTSVRARITLASGGSFLYTTPYTTGCP